MNSQNSTQDRSLRTLSLHLILAFKFLAWTNGLGLALVTLCALGLLGADIPPYLLRLPLAAFLGGLILAGLGLLWAYLEQLNLYARLAGHYRRRTHWVPLFCVIAFYLFSLLAFAVGMWFFVNLAALVYEGAEALPQAYDNSHALEQSAGPLKQAYLRGWQSQD